MADAVNHPDHYNFGKIEVIKYIDSLGAGYDFAKGNAIKYIARAGRKGDKAEDLKKALFYVDHMIDQQDHEHRPTYDEQWPDPIAIDTVLEDWTLPESLCMALYGVVVGGRQLYKAKDSLAAYIANLEEKR